MNTTAWLKPSLMGARHRPYARTTAAAIAVIVAMSLVFAAIAVRAIVTFEGGPPAAPDAVVFGLTSETAGNAVWLAAGLMLTVCLLALVVAAGIARRNPGARHAGIALFVVLGAVCVASAFAGITADPPARNAGYGFLSGVMNLVIVGLLLARSTAADFDRAELDRRRRMSRGK
jgi:ABC-type Fe3+ transport system permease subunit